MVSDTPGHDRSDPPPPPPDARARVSGGGDAGMELRPRSVGEILDAAFRIYRDHWQLLMGAVAVAVVPLSLLFGGLALTESLALIVIAAIVTGLLIGPLVSAAIVKLGAELVRGHELTIGETYRFALTRLAPLLGAAVLVGLGVFVGFLLLIVPGVILFVRWYFATIVVVLEQRGVTDSIKRSWSLTSGNFGKTFGTLAAMFLLVIVVQFVVGLALGLVFGVFGVFPEWVQLLLDTVAQVVVTPFTSLVGIILYLDLRIRQEGYDLQVMARELQRG